MLQILACIIAAPLVGAAGVLFLSTRWAGRIALVPPIIVLALVLPRWSPAAEGITTIVPIAWFPSLRMTADLRFDYLGAFFVVLVAGVGLGVVQYSRVYLGPNASPRFWATLLAFMGAMLGIVLSDSLILLFVFWEITSICSALLIGLNFEDSAARIGAVSALLVTNFGGLCLLAGIALLGQMFGTYNLSEMESHAESIVARPMHVVPLVLLLIGAFTKSAQFPFHFWLPGAMAAPPPISAYLHSATMVKAGVFLIGRLFPIFGESWIWQPILITIGFTTFLVGGWDAMRAWDLKKLLAYSTVANLGLLVALYGLYTHGYVRGELLNIANHALYKSALFLLVGWMEKVAGTRDLSVLKNEHWFQREPVGGILVGIGALAMGGAPFLLGFMSKEALFEAVLAAPMPIAPVAAVAGVLGGSMALAYGLKLFVSTFWGPQPPSETRASSSQTISPWLLIVPAILLVPQIIGGIAPGWFIGEVLEPGTKWPAWFAIWHHIDALFALSVLTLALGIATYLIWRHILPSPSPPRTQIGFGHLADTTLAVSSWFSRAIQTGGHPRYLTVTLLFAIGVSFIAVVASDAVPIAVMETPAIKPGAAWLPAIVAAAGAILTIFVPGRAAKLVTMAVSGYGIALFYIVFRAPDVALTQILVETIALVLLLLALRRLPHLGPDQRTRFEHFAHGFVAVIAGLGLSALAWFSGIHQVGRSAGNAHLALSLPEAHGRNVVNVILVDFRGADTLGEISVLAIAAIGVAALLLPAVYGLSPESESKRS